jgi:GH25 family lysozyme M1 (1,4-beta-N-acetylmuramidase)/peptidoglycan hydrolase-like protein with peptidoglycan-binding domain
MDSGVYVVIAKLLTGYLKISEKITDADSYIKVNGLYDADFVAYVVGWQGNHGCTPNGEIGPDEWAAIAKAAPTCSTSKNRTSGYTLALQLALGGNLTPDAIYGQRTKAAVATYQDAQGLDADGICGQKTWNSLIVGEAKPQPTPGTFTQPIDYKQASKPWGPRMYSNHNDHKQTMANSGCGPTACADAVATLKDPAVDPWTLAQLAMEWGDRTYNSGTAWTLFKHVAEHYGFTKFVQSGSYSALTACLDAGGYVVCSMKKGYWTNGGHFICAWKYDGTYTYANDPASSSRKKQKTAQFKSECKQYFCFYPDPTQPEPAKEPTSNEVKRGEHIVDISKYQPDVDYDALISDTALIILRAGYRGTGGGIHEDQKFALHASELKKRGVKFGVYFYSIATNEDKAREEARMFYSYAKDYNPLFWAGDFEKDSITTGAIVAFVDELRKLGAKKVGCYVANHLYNKYDYASIADQMDFTWIPRYGSTKPVHKCDLWQFTSTGSANGINGNVDMSRITGEGHDLAWFTEG